MYRTNDTDVWKSRYFNLVSLVEGKVPGFEIRYKTQVTSPFLRFAFFIVGIFNKGFRERVTTTIYPHVYFPSQQSVLAVPQRSFSVMAHEFVHLHDWQRNPTWFPIGYLFPQVLSVFSLLSLLSFIDLCFLWSLLFLLFLLPLPAPWRVKWEIRGYAMTMAIESWLTGTVSEETRTSIVDKFTGWHYYRMALSRKRTRKLVDHVAGLVSSRHYTYGGDSAPYSAVRVVWLTSSSNW